MTDLDSPETLMRAHIWNLLPTPRHHAYVCSAGIQGYHALKEMLQDPEFVTDRKGGTILLESGDLRGITDTDVSPPADQSSRHCSVLTVGDNWEPLREHLDVPHLAILTNLTHLPFEAPYHNPYSRGFLRILGHDAFGFLQNHTALKTLDLSRVPHLKTLPEGFLQGCTGMTTLDLSPLVNVKQLPQDFLRGCTGLTTLDLRPLSHLKELPRDFLQWCTGLTTLDLSPLVILAKPVTWTVLR